MITAKAIITTAGASLLQAANASSPLTISKIVVAQAVASPTSDQVVAGSAGATSLSLPKYTADSGLHVARDLRGKHIAIRFKIPDFSFDYWVAQFGIYSGTTLIGIASIPAHMRNSSSGAVEYIALLPVSDVAKVTTNRNSLNLISKSSLATFQNDTNNELTASFPIGAEGSTIQAISSGSTQAIRLVTLTTIVENSADYETEKARVTSPVGGRKVIDLSTRKIATQNANSTWSEQTYVDDAALATAVGKGRIHHNKYSGKTYYVTNNLIRRIF